MTFANINSGSFANNIIANKRSDSGQFAMKTIDGMGWESEGYGVRNFSIDSNVVYNWRGRVEFIEPFEGNPVPILENISFTNNTLQAVDPADDRALIRTYTTDPQVVAYSGNTYHHSAAPAGEWFMINGNDQSYSQWVSATGEVGAQQQLDKFLDPTRGSESYAATLGLTSYDEYIDALMQRSKDNWDHAYSADAINDYIRTGFELTTEEEVDEDLVDVGDHDAAGSTRYWVGGSGNWSDSSNWSQSAGGAGGASVPSVTDDVVFDAFANGTTITIDSNEQVRDLIVQAGAGSNFTIELGSSTLECTRDCLLLGGVLDQGNGSTLIVGRNLDTSNIDLSQNSGNMSVHLVGTGTWRYTLGESGQPRPYQPVVWNLLAAQNGHTTTLRPVGNAPLGIDIDVETQLQLGDASSTLTMELQEATNARATVTLEIHSTTDKLYIVSFGAHVNISNIEHELSGNQTGFIQGNVAYGDLDTFDITGRCNASAGSGPTWFLQGDLDISEARLSIEKTAAIDTRGHDLAAESIRVGSSSKGTGQLLVRDSTITIANDLEIGTGRDRHGHVDLGTGSITAASLRSDDDGNGSITGGVGSFIELTDYTAGAGTTYYISTANANNGLSQANAFATLEHALQVAGADARIVAEAGDVLTLNDPVNVSDLRIEFVAGAP